MRNNKTHRRVVLEPFLGDCTICIPTTTNDDRGCLLLVDTSTIFDKQKLIWVGLNSHSKCNRLMPWQLGLESTGSIRE